MAEWLRRTPAKCIPKGARVRTSAVTAFLFAYQRRFLHLAAGLLLTSVTLELIPSVSTATALHFITRQATLRGRPGAAYVDIPSNVLMAPLPASLNPSQVRRYLASCLGVASLVHPSRCGAVLLFEPVMRLAAVDCRRQSDRS